MCEYYIGLMSGTSLDAIDAVLVSCQSDQINLLYSVSCPLSPDLRQQLLELTMSGEDEIEKLAIAEPAFARESAKAVEQLLALTTIQPENITAIGSHGQTIRHRPEKGYTLQIGDPSLIAELTNITVVGDFRRRDIAAGGQGAPLVTAFHKAAFSSPDENRVITNVGGMANISILSSHQPVTGFDTGPGNVLMDQWCMTHQKIPYDKGGAWAATAQFNQSLLDCFMADSFFKLPRPKSTGRELFNPVWLNAILDDFRNLDPSVIQATLCRMTAKSIADAILKHAPETAAVFLCGGGAHNKTLKRHLQDELGDQRVDTTNALNIAPDWVEAIAFAWLAKQTLTHQPANLPAATGARGLRILGAIYPT